jgi:hypothetical protein
MLLRYFHLIKTAPDPGTFICRCCGTYFERLIGDALHCPEGCGCDFDPIPVGPPSERWYRRDLNPERQSELWT